MEYTFYEDVGDAEQASAEDALSSLAELKPLEQAVRTAHAQVLLTTYGLLTTTYTTNYLRRTPRCEASGSELAPDLPPLTTPLPPPSHPLLAPLPSPYQPPTTPLPTPCDLYLH